jgi:hypothetical protein
MHNWISITFLMHWNINQIKIAQFAFQKDVFTLDYGKTQTN